MKIRSARKGSALLIVLGMCAFMLVSAIAFSAYMRYSRLPSSYLRRTASTRLLVKAALARAIDAVDRAVNNNPHPGVGTMGCGGPNRNIWTHRVFMGTNAWANVSDTVTPLCLEGLAYIPPPLVNEARYYSRRSPASQWASLGFDSGRYCYCALDVSDYFDINRLTANSARSSAPIRRTSLAYLFESDSHKSPGNGANSWDTFMEQFRGQADEDTLQFDFKSQAPLISMADFNLALGRKGTIGDLHSPFYDYITKGGQGTGFYNTSSEKDEDKIRRMTFVTDGLFPQDEEEVTDDDGNVIKRYDLNDGDNQPFAPDFLAATKPALSDAVLGKRLLSDSNMKWLEHLSGLGCAALYDYLDPDHVPISLAIPTTERVPMICGMRPTLQGAELGVTKVLEPENGEKVLSGDKTTRQVECTVRYRIDPNKFIESFMRGHVETLVTFPFAHEDEMDGSFNVDGRFSLFFTSEDMGLRTGEANDVLHLTTPNLGRTGLDAQNGLINVKLKAEAVSFPKKITREEEAVKMYPLSLQEGQALGPFFRMNGNELLQITYRWTQTNKAQTGGVVNLQEDWEPKFDAVWQNPSLASEVTAHCGIPALRANGTVDPDFRDQALANIIKGGVGAGKRMKLDAAVWLRVKDSQGKIVDMVPACLTDDKLQNQVNDPDPRIEVLGKQEFAGQPFPVMRFDTGVDFTLSVEKLEEMLTTAPGVTLSPEVALVADPRYNFAPEHWFAHSGNLTPETWLENNQCGGGDRDGDIFMATSDAGYLQSPYEVAFLPRLTDLRNFGGTVAAGNLHPPDGGNYRTIPDSFGATRNSGFAWRTFDPIDIDFDAFEDLPWTSAGNGFKVNPYSDSTNVLMAVFANTPIDWKRASTNLMQGASECAGDYMDDAAGFNKKYAYNEYSSGPKIAWRDLERMAGSFHDRVLNERDWKTAWESLDWYDDEDKIFNFTLDGETDPLWFSDRKFLYGYWHDCFAVKQQLFLIFVRAEPMMMGGGAVGQIPPQLGARACALVWRDPRASKEADDPHQTRILFYRQFE